MIKKTVAATMLIFLYIFSLSAFTADDIRTFTLNNGLIVFVLSDPSAAPVRIELSIDAGFSRQTDKTAGFFLLYARLIGADCSADTVRITKTVAPGAVEQTIQSLTSYFQPLATTDAALSAGLEKLKTEVTGYAGSTAGFINTAIDARMFTDAPWKQESGIYPALFTKTTAAEARTVLRSIGSEYYQPDNAVLFISGAIEPEAALALVSRCFDTGTARSRQEQPATAEPDSTAAAYVLSDERFSPDITQIVVQYKNIPAGAADTIAAVFNEDDSFFKQQLLKEKTLGIREAAYINAASVQQRGTSRLVIQSILESAKATPVEQAALFVKKTQAQQEKLLAQPAVTAAQSKNKYAFEQMADNSSSLMELFSAWRALTGSSDPQSLFDQTGSETEQTGIELAGIYGRAVPVVFILVNKSVYQKYQKQFAKAGYELVTVKNGSWYTKELTRFTAGKTEDTVPAEHQDTAPYSAYDAATKYIETNRSDFSFLSLANGIPVALKRNETAQTAALCITISGGEQLFAQTNPGLCEVVTSVLVKNIRDQLDSREKSGVMHGRTQIESETTATETTITITCPAADTAVCVEAAGTALIYGDITPASADAGIYSVRTKWRIQSASTEFQLFSAAVRTVCKGTGYDLLYQNTTEILTGITYTEIAAAYQKFLEPSRYSIALCGGLADSGALLAVLNRTFGTLIVLPDQTPPPAKKNPPPIRAQSVKVPLRHLFLTDTPADKAGPRPENLIPTTKFSDPVLYCIPGPDISDSDYPLFTALIYEIADRLQKKVDTQSVVHAAVPARDFPFACITITHVDSIRALKTAYTSVITGLLQELTPGSSESDSALLQRIKDRWVLKTLSETASPAATAKLTAAGYSADTGARYLNDYKEIADADKEQIAAVAQQWLSTSSQLMVYSADAR